MTKGEGLCTIEKKNKGGENMPGTSCETCANYVYDELADCYFCSVNLDEDELCRFMAEKSASCSYWRNGDDYVMVKKQN